MKQAIRRGRLFFCRELLIFCHMNPRYSLIAITALAGALRFYGLGSESLWLDEAYVAERVSRAWAGVFYHWDAQWQGFLFAVIEKLWAELWGRSEVALRLLPALFGTLAVPALYRLGARIFAPSAGLLAAFLLAINPCAIHYSQDARPYSLFLLLVVLAVESGLRLLESDTRMRRSLFVASTTGTLYAHPFGVFILPLCVALPFAGRTGVKRGYRRMVLLAALLYVPMCAIFLRSLILKSTGVLHDADFILPVTWALLWGMYQQYFMSAAAAWFSLALMVAAALWGALRKVELRVWRVPELLGICFVLLPVLLSWLITPLVVLRYTIPALAGLLLLLAWSLHVLPRWVSALALASLTYFSATALHDYYTKIDKDPWRQTVAMMRPFAKPGDVIVVNPSWTDKPFNYYVTPADQWEIHALKYADSLQAFIGAQTRFWIVNSYHTGASNQPRLVGPPDSLLYERLSITAADSLDLNPRAIHFRRMRATLYTRRDTGLGQAALPDPGGEAAQ